MDNTMKSCLSYLLLVLLIRETYTHKDKNETFTKEDRQPRVSGRIVKVYSGSRPEPILCPNEGFHPDPVDCAVFYRCVKAANEKFTVFRFQCGPGTIYDPDTEICNHPKSTKRSECGGIIISSTEKSNENEIDGAQQELPSPINTRVPVYTTSTTAVKNVSTLTTISTVSPWISSTKHESSKPSSVSTTNRWFTAIEQKGSTRPVRTTTAFVTHQPTLQNGEPCISDGFMGDSENCRRFYRCVNNGRGGFIRYEFSCSESTIWDDDVQVCNHVWAVKKRRCGRGQQDIKTKPLMTESENRVTTNGPISQQHVIYGTKAFQAHKDMSNGLSINYLPKNNYTNQEDTNIRPNEIVTTNIWDSPIQFKNDNSDKIKIYSTTRSLPFSTEMSITDSDTEGQGYELTTQHKKSNKSDNKCTESGFMADKSDCKKFYRCVDNGRGSYTIHEFSCGEGTVWDSELEACNHAWAVKECGHMKYETTTQGTNTTSTMKSTQGSQTITESLTGNEDEDIGYGNQNQISTTIHTTTNPISTTTVAPFKDVCKSSGFIGDINDCKKFYRCVDNGRGSFIKYEYKCGEGTVWDSEMEACNHNWAVKRCGGNSTSESNKVETTTEGEIVIMTTISLIQTSTLTPTKNDDYDTGYGLQQQESSATTTSKPITTKRPQGEHNSNHNNCKSSGFMGDINDCKKFYRCVDSGNGAYIRYEFSCGEGTVWDSQIEACNHEWAVKTCGGVTENDNKLDETTSQYNSTLSDSQNGYPSQSDKETDRPTQSTTYITSTDASITNDKEPNENNECVSSGFIGDNNNCKKFYRCVDNGKGSFIRYEFSCGEGTVWDQRVEACNHASSVRNCRDRGNDSTTIQSQSSTETISATVSNIDDYDQGYGISSTRKTTTTNIPTSADSEMSNNSVCIKEGFVGDNNDCKKFYRCVDNGRGGFIKYDFTCGEGTVWDEKIQSCNHPSGTSLCKKESSNELEHESDEMTIVSTTETSASSPTSESISGTDSTQKPHLLSGTCKSEGFYGDYNDCKKFYRCVDNGKGSYTKYDFTCGDGTVWDEKVQACNHDSEKRNCSTTSTASPNYTSETNNINQSTSTSTETQEPTVKTTISPTNEPSDQCTSEGFYANSNNCKKFFRCVSNDKGGYTKYEFTCGDGTVWVQDIQACDHDSDASSCQSHSDDTLEPQTTETLQSSSTSSSTISTTQYQTTEKENDEYSGQTSSGDCTSEGFYPNKNDCKHFYRCVDNGHGEYTKYDFTCGEGTAWDIEINACNHVSEVENCRNSNQEQSQTEPVMSDTDSPKTTTSDKETTTTPTTTKTSTSTTTTEGNESQPTNKNICEKEGFFGNSEDCKKFYRCVDNGKGGLMKYDYTCGEGTIWDQDITTCNHPQDVSNPSCKEDTGSSSTTSTSSSSSVPQTTDSTESSSQSTTNCSQEQTSKKPSNITCDKAGFYAHPDDCKKFYRCVDWDGDGKRFSVFHFDCGEGTIWDPALETCNYEESVYPRRECSGKQSQNESTTQVSTTENETTTKQSETTTTSEYTTQSETTTTEETATDKTTTQQSASEQTSTEGTTSQPTSSEYSTTEQSTSTSHQTTTSEPTTEKTTDQSTTEQSTTEQITPESQTSTTEQSTTEQTTAESQTSTTEQSTTEQMTTESQTSTTEQSTTEQTTTESQTSTTEQSTTEQTTTESQPSTTEQSTTEQTTTESQPSTTEQSTTEQTTTESQPSTTEQSTTEQTTTDIQTSTIEGSTSEQTTESQTSTTEESTSTTSKDDESGTTQSDQETTTEDNGSSSSNECPDTDDDQHLYVCPTSFRRHPKYCNMFYQCTEDDDSHELKIALFKCPNNTIYDESQTQCVEEDKANKKCDGEIAQKRRIKRLDSSYKEAIEVSGDKQPCPTVGHFPFERNTKCSPAFLKCQKSKAGKLRGYVYQCPKGYVYWSVSRRCELDNNVTDCKHSINDWIGRWEIPVEKRNVAP